MDDAKSTGLRVSEATGSAGLGQHAPQHSAPNCFVQATALVCCTNETAYCAAASFGLPVEWPHRPTCRKNIAQLSRTEDGQQQQGSAYAPYTDLDMLQSVKAAPQHCQQSVALLSVELSTTAASTFGAGACRQAICQGAPRFPLGAAHNVVQAK